VPSEVDPAPRRAAQAGARRKVVLATGNAGKVRELQDLLGAAFEIIPQSRLGVRSVPETGQTFLANALIKARHAASASALPAIADDSGLEVAALGGAPGVLSARYAGEGASDADNVDTLLAELAGHPNRSARFRCVLAYVRNADDPDPIVAEGIWEGHIAEAARGTAGFGYDPVFVDPLSGLTAAELPSSIKNVRSHRGQAALQLRAALTKGP
jgi:XTP/dITP diphosphohydrolase